MDKPALILRRFDSHDDQRIPFLSTMSMILTAILKSLMPLHDSRQVQTMI